jgi:hypothetical protein
VEVDPWDDVRDDVGERLILLIKEFKSVVVER